jgi:hypothetical protein
VGRWQKLAFAGKLPERKNPDQAISIFRMESGMAYISQRGEYWRAEGRRRGYKPVYRAFDTKQQAQKWARHVEGEMDAGSFVDRSEAERTTVADALKRNRKEIAPEKRHPYQEERRIDRWLDNDLAHRTPGPEYRQPCETQPPRSASVVFAGRPLVTAGIWSDMACVLSSSLVTRPDRKCHKHTVDLQIGKG